MCYCIECVYDIMVKLMTWGTTLAYDLSKKCYEVQSPQNVFQTVLNAKVLKKRIAWFVLKDFKVDLKLKYMYIVSFSLDDPQLESFIVKEAELSTINQVNLKNLNILFLT